MTLAVEDRRVLNVESFFIITSYFLLIFVGDCGIVFESSAIQGYILTSSSYITMLSNLRRRLCSEGLCNMITSQFICYCPFLLRLIITDIITISCITCTSSNVCSSNRRHESSNKNSLQKTIKINKQHKTIMFQNKWNNVTTIISVYSKVLSVYNQKCISTRI